MADIVLSKEDFGLKLYNKFPPRYREDDVETNYALRRYLEVIAEGGFSYSIDEWNGILNFADPDQATPQALPILFKQFGLDVFNGIPEAFLRYLLPRIGTAWSKKGGLDVIEFVASSISGVKTSTVAHPLPNGETDIDVRLEMDFSLGGYFPEPKQLGRILTQFLPFYLGLRIIYVYMYLDYINIIAKDDSYVDHVTHTLDDSGSFSHDGYDEIPLIFPSDKILNDDFILNYREQVCPVPDVFFDVLSNRVLETGYINSDWSSFELNIVKVAPVLDSASLVTEASDSRKDHVTMLSTSFLPTLNVDSLVLNEGFETNTVSKGEEGSVQVTEEVSSVQVSSSVSEVAVFVAPVLGMLTNTKGCVLNGSSFDTFGGYDIVKCRDGTETVIFF